MATVATMGDTLHNRFWQRESGYLTPRAALRSIYGSKEWVNDLDIVNELGGHTGCVNALRYASETSPSGWLPIFPLCLALVICWFMR